MGFTMAMVQRAIERYERDGRVATFAHHSSVESVDGQWYVFIVDEEGNTIAHHNPEFVGRDPAFARPTRDPTCYFYGDDALGNPFPLSLCDKFPNGGCRTRMTQRTRRHNVLTQRPLRALHMPRRFG